MSAARGRLLRLLAAVLLAVPFAAGGESLYATLKPILRPKKVEPGGSKIDFDDAGVPWVDYGGDLGRQRNAVTVAQMAQEHWKQWKSGEAGMRSRFLSCADWLVEKGVRREGYTVYEYTFDWRMYGMVAPWQSALAQGEALKVLARAHEATGEDRYLETARAVLKTFFVEVADGGVTYKSESDGWWYEEYASKEGRETRVLNGMMGALLGLHEYRSLSQDAQATDLFDRGILALKRNLPAYDLPEKWTSYYAYGFDPAGREYHEVHIRQLSELFEITRDPMLLEYRDRWADYVSDSFFVLLVRDPNARRIRSILVSFAVLFLLLEAMAWRRRRRAAIRT